MASDDAQPRAPLRRYQIPRAFFQICQKAFATHGISARKRARMNRAAIPVLAPIALFCALLALGGAFPAIAGVLNLSLPFFGLIALGYVCGRLIEIPEEGLQWMNFFIVYAALPALFYNLVSATPFEQLSNWPFIAGTTASTAAAFTLALIVGLLATRGDWRAAAIQGVAGAYSNIGYMGPGLTMAALGPQSAAPTALIFAFDSMLLFTLTPVFMALTGPRRAGFWETAATIARRVATHPFNVATAAGIFAAWLHFRPPAPVAKMLEFLQNAAAPSALFVMGATIGLRRAARIAPEAPALLFIKLVLHPLIVWSALSYIGDFGREWTFTAVLMASLPPALNVFVLANQYQTYVERASSIILAGTLASVVTVTALLYAIATNAVPYRLFQP